MCWRSPLFSTLKYVNTTIKCKIAYTKKEGFIAFADADWATDKIDRKSITGNIIMLAGGPIPENKKALLNCLLKWNIWLHQTVENRSSG